jgi:putative ABC transport system ATP-binding protein
VSDIVVDGRGLERVFGDGPNAVAALRDATCRVLAGEAIGLVGPSGSGKSTLLHLLAGIDRPTAGTIEWPVLGAHPATTRPGTVGLVFQGPSLLPALNAVENVTFPLLLAGEEYASAEPIALAALDRLGVAEVARQLPEELSAGQSQRVATARALAGRPRLVLADEPTGQLDHATAEVVVGALLAAVAGGAALVVSTHDERVASRFGRRWAMSDGRLLSEVPA